MIATSLRLLRVIHGAMCFYLVALVGFTYVFRPKAPAPDKSVFIALAVVAGIAAAFGVFLWKVRVPLGLEYLRKNPEDKEGLMLWRMGSIVAWACADGVALFGIALRFLGYGFADVILFFVVSAALFVLTRPQVPQGANSSGAVQRFQFWMKLCRAYGTLLIFNAPYPALPSGAKLCRPLRGLGSRRYAV